MDSQRLRFLMRIALVCAAIIILFFSGLIPFEDYLADAVPEGQSASVVAADVAALTNQSRKENGLPPLAISPLLNQAAQLKAEDMAKNSYYAHVSPDGKSALYWLQLVGYKYLNAGENLVIDRNTSQEAVDAWLHSEAHRANILRPQFTEIGVGVAPGRYKGEDTIYVVQEFGTPYPLAANRIATPAPTPKHDLVPSTTPRQEATPAANTTFRIVPKLSVTPVPRTSIVTTVDSAAVPIVHALAPVLKTKPASHATPPEAASSSPSERGQGSSATTTIVTSSFAYALPPEFFAPVSYAAPSESGPVVGEGSDTASRTAVELSPQQVARPNLLSRILPAANSAFSKLGSSLRYFLVH